ncbi:MAG: hypothetical protein ACLT5P_09805 [Flavonifractor plautii]
MKRNRLEKLGDFVLGKGFYIVLFLCVAAIGISGYYLIRSVSGSSRRRSRCEPQRHPAGRDAVFPGEQSTSLSLRRSRRLSRTILNRRRTRRRPHRRSPGGGLHLAGEGAGAPGLHGGGPGL